MNLPEYTYYENPELMTDYRQLMINYFKLIEPKALQKNITDRVERMILFEKDFVKVFPHPEIERQRWSEPRQETQQTFVQKYPQTPFPDFLKTAPTSSFVFNVYPEANQFLNDKLKLENLQVLKDFYMYSSVRPQDDSNPEYFDQQFKFANKYCGCSR